MYAYPESQLVIPLNCPAGTTIAEAIQISGITNYYPELREPEIKVGVYGYKQRHDYVLSDHDRVEIYRPLQVTPTEARRLRAKAKCKTEGTAQTL